MSNSLTKGFIALAKKSLAIISSSLAAISNVHAEENPITPMLDILGEHFLAVDEKLPLAPKLILKLNKSNPENQLFYLHTSHSSHASHASHASHSSHYSSSPSYTPTPKPVPVPYNPQPVPAKVPSTPKSYSNGNPITNSTSKKSDTTLIIPSTAFRTLFKGCEGNDVLKLQNLLIVIGYYNLSTGYFGDKTEAAVIKFQSENELRPDGRVTYSVYLAMRNKLL